MSKTDKKEQNKQCTIPSVMYSGYAIRFNEVDGMGNMYKPNCFNEDDFKEMKLRGHIVDYEIDENGVKIIKKMDIDGVSI